VTFFEFRFTAGKLGLELCDAPERIQTRFTFALTLVT
jgi:hypothetical protein